MTKKGKAGILWFRNDLRLSDNESLTDAVNTCDNIIPVYIFDNRINYTRGLYGHHRIGPHRIRFLLESLSDLKQALIERGSDLIIRRGNTEDIIYDLCKKTNSSLLFCNRERTREELEVQDLTERRIWTLGAEMRYNRGKMLYYTADLPFPITHAPDNFSAFRKEVEKYIEVREPLETPEHISSHFHNIDLGNIDHLFSEEEEALIGTSESSIFEGGESCAAERLQEFLNNSIDVEEIFRLEEAGSLLSPYLSKGCISPKQVFYALNNGKSTIHNTHKYTKILINLLQRDYHRLMAKKYQMEYFEMSGIKESSREKEFDQEKHELWIEGKTDQPLVNALMKELKSIGFLPMHSRQIVAQYYIYELGLPWKSGAEYFEYILIDHDPASNYGNWRAIANLGPDDLEFKPYSLEHFQEKHYADQSFQEYWLAK